MKQWEEDKKILRERSERIMAHQQRGIIILLDEDGGMEYSSGIGTQEIFDRLVYYLQGLNERRNNNDGIVI